jgi:hypothetical protein
MYLAKGDRTQSGFWKAVVAIIAEHEFIVRTSHGVERMTGLELIKYIQSDPKLLLSFDYDGVTNERNCVQPELLALLRELLRWSMVITGNDKAYIDKTITGPVIFVNPRGSPENSTPVQSAFPQVVALLKIGFLKLLQESTGNTYMHVDDSPLCRLLGRCSNGISSKSEDNKNGDTTFILKGPPDHSTLIFKIMQSLSGRLNTQKFDNEILDFLMRCLEVIGLKRNSFQFPNVYNPHNVERFVKELDTSDFHKFLNEEKQLFRVLLSGPRGLGKTSLGATLSILFKVFKLPVYHITGDISNMGSPATMQAILLLLESMLLRLKTRAIIIVESVQNEPIVPPHVSQFMFKLTLPTSLSDVRYLAEKAYEPKLFIQCNSAHVDNTPSLSMMPINGVVARNPRPYAYFLAIVRIIMRNNVVDEKLTNELAGLSDDERAEVWGMLLNGYLYTAYFIGDDDVKTLLGAVSNP